MKLTVEKVEEILCKPCGHRVNVAADQPFSTIQCPHCQSRLRVPANFGPFRLIRVLGTGAMAQVFQAIDRTLGRHVAIKVIRKSSRENMARIKSCLEEARALASLNHPNVVQVHAVGQLDGHPYIVMELVDGGRLDQLISAVNPISESRALKIAIDISEGLKAANQVGLVHGDVKPGNILIDRSGVAKLVDFGIVRYRNQQTGEKVYGTPQYVAPEVALKRDVDHRADIFSLGSTLFHALSGDFPFHGQTTNDMILARIHQQAADLRSIRPLLHIETARTVARMLEPEPTDRYPSYDELLSDLRVALIASQQKPPSVDLERLDQALRQTYTPSRLHPRVNRSKRAWSIARIIMTLLVIIIGAGSLIAILLWGASQT